MRDIKAFVKQLKLKYFSADSDLRLQIFTLFACAGIVSAFIITGHAIYIRSSAPDIAIKGLSGVFSLFMLIYCHKSKRYQFCYTVSLFMVFIVFFTAMFFTSGGYQTGITSFFVFAAVVTACMLDGAVMFSMLGLELCWYTAISVYSYYNPHLVSGRVEGAQLLLDIVICFVSSSLVVGYTTYKQVSLYKKQQKKLDQQNILLAESNRTKTEFLSNTSHEMRTPLTVVSVNIQMVMGMLKRAEQLGDDSEVRELLADAQEEIMRLSRMVAGMLSINSLSENDDRAKTDFELLLRSVGDILRLVFAQKSNQIEIVSQGDLQVFCNADLVSQVIINLAQNANKHTENDTITLRAAMKEGHVHVQISDNGSGISPELLPNVFKRGVTKGGTGFGLYLCKMVIESHGGNIWIESEQEVGTTVHFTLPPYQGQI